MLELLNLQNTSFAQVECYSREFMDYCIMVDKAKSITNQISALKRKMSTLEFRHILENYTSDIIEIVCMVTERRIRMFKVKSLNFQTDCLPYFEELLSIIHSCFYAVIETKNVSLVEVSINFFHYTEIYHKHALYGKLTIDSIGGKYYYITVLLSDRAEVIYKCLCLCNDDDDESISSLSSTLNLLSIKVFEYPSTFHSVDPTLIYLS